MVAIFLACLYEEQGGRKGSRWLADADADADADASGRGGEDGRHAQDQEADPSSFPTSIPSIYVQPAHPFPSVEDFIRSSARHYHLAIQTYPTAAADVADPTSEAPPTDMKSIFAAYLAANPAVRAVLVGTRRTDPHGAALTHFDRTDRGWPDFMRVHPVIDWRYAEIWAFIRHLGIDYCPLYDAGYSSLGGMDNTRPNPRLRRENNSGGTGEEYRPAYEL
ncbi:hypothetical protein KEM52_004792, partial [Ascosphaera acerosa]